MYSRWKSGENGADTRKKCKKKNPAGGVCRSPAGMLWWMGSDGGSDAELFRDEIVNLIQLDL